MITPLFALGVFVLILIVSGVLAWFLRDYHNYDKGSFHTFISILMGLGVFVTFMFYYAIVEEQQEQRQVASIQGLTQLNASLINSVLKEMNNAAPIIPNFVNSVNPLTSTGASTTGIDPTTAEASAMRSTLSYRIFSTWQDVLVTDSILINFDRIAYLCNFLQRSNSAELFVIWHQICIDFTSKTQKFGNLLFEYGLPIQIQAPESYYQSAVKLSNDPRYLELL